MKNFGALEYEPVDSIQKYVRSFDGKLNKQEKGTKKNRRIQRSRGRTLHHFKKYMLPEYKTIFAIKLLYYSAGVYVPIFTSYIIYTGNKKKHIWRRLQRKTRIFNINADRPRKIVKLTTMQRQKGKKRMEAYMNTEKCIGK